MIHGPHTIVEEDAFPEYHCRFTAMGDRTFNKIIGGREVSIDKYRYKYITKGSEGQSEQHQVHNEVNNCINERYSSSSEAFWPIYGYPLHDCKPAIEKLLCHLKKINKLSSLKKVRQVLLDTQVHQTPSQLTISNLIYVTPKQDISCTQICLNFTLGMSRKRIRIPTPFTKN